MRLIQQHVKTHGQIKTAREVYFSIADAARTCYGNTAAGSSLDSCAEIIKHCIARGHESVLEHENISFEIVTNRGVSHELVRHRLAAYSQESTRYCKYSGHISFIRPVWLEGFEAGVYSNDNAIIQQYGNVPVVSLDFMTSLYAAEDYYKQLLEGGWKAEQAREVLPNATATKLRMTANIREWRHIVKLRCSKNAHPQMQALAKEILGILCYTYPVIFADVIEYLEQENDEDLERICNE